jgi:hypothetical protein
MSKKEEVEEVEVEGDVEANVEEGEMSYYDCICLYFDFTTVQEKLGGGLVIAEGNVSGSNVK